MPGLDGLELQQAMTDAGAQRSIIFIIRKGDIQTSVRAMKAGEIATKSPMGPKANSTRVRPR